MPQSTMQSEGSCIHFADCSGSNYCIWYMVKASSRFWPFTGSVKSVTGVESVWKEVTTSHSWTLPTGVRSHQLFVTLSFSSFQIYFLICRFGKWENLRTKLICFANQSGCSQLQVTENPVKTALKTQARHMEDAVQETKPPPVFFVSVLEPGCSNQL